MAAPRAGRPGWSPQRSGGDAGGPSGKRPARRCVGSTHWLDRGRLGDRRGLRDRDHDDRAGRRADALLGDRTENGVEEPAVAVAAQDEQLGVAGGLRQYLGRGALDRLGGDRHARVGGGHGRHGAGERLLGAGPLPGPGWDGAMPVLLTSLEPLAAALRADGYRVVGPTVRDGAIVLADLESAADLPSGRGVTVAPGGYRLRERGDRAAFGHSAGPQSWKSFLHPPRSPLWTARRDGGSDGDGGAGGDG